jgi:cytochrome c oxidase subunit 2
MKPAIRLTLVFITLFSLWLFVAQPWWFPEGASAHSAMLNHQFHVAFLVFGLLFLAGQLVLAWVLGLSRTRGHVPSAASPSWRGNWVLECAWTLIITTVFFWFNLSGSRLWSEMIHRFQPAGAVRVEVTGVQFQWYFRYPGADGKFGSIDAQKYARPSEGNPLGLDPADPAGRDDVVAATLMLPVDRDVELTLRAQDVIHSVFIPAMRFKQDAVPGMEIRARLRPTRIGTYEIVCSQLCGLGHYRMRATARVVSDEEFNRWLRTQSTAAVQ